MIGPLNSDYLEFRDATFKHSPRLLLTAVQIAGVKIIISSALHACSFHFIKHTYFSMLRHMRDVCEVKKIPILETTEHCEMKDVLQISNNICQFHLAQVWFCKIHALDPFIIYRDPESKLIFCSVL